MRPRQLLPCMPGRLLSARLHTRSLGHRRRDPARLLTRHRLAQRQRDAQLEAVIGPAVIGHLHARQRGVQVAHVQRARRAQARLARLSAQAVRCCSTLCTRCYSVRAAAGAGGSNSSAGAHRPSPDIRVSRTPAAPPCAAQPHSLPDAHDAAVAMVAQAGTNGCLCVGRSGPSPARLSCSAATARSGRSAARTRAAGSAGRGPWPSSGRSASARPRSAPSAAAAAAQGGASSAPARVRAAAR